MENQIVKLNPFFRIQFSKEEDTNALDIELFLEDKVIRINDISFLNVINKVKSGVHYSELLEIFKEEYDFNNNEAKDLVDSLINKKLLVLPSYTKKEMQSVKHWINRGWLDALMLHLSIKNLQYPDDDFEDTIDENNKMFSDLIENEGLPEIYKKYPQNYDLPKPESLDKSKSFESVLLARRSHKKWTKKPYTLQELSNILFYSSIETKKLRDNVKENIMEEPNILMNASFSALEVYFFAHNVEGIEKGLYFYDVEDHKISCVKKGEFRDQVTKMCIGQEAAGSGKISFVITSKWHRYMYRYRHAMGYRSILINTSELAQKIIILNTIYEKNTFLTPALEDELADDLLDLNSIEEAPLYVVAAG